MKPAALAELEKARGAWAKREVDRTLNLLRSKIQRAGTTQLEVQRRLGWGASYLSQLMCKNKALRFEQLFAVLNVLEIEPEEFFGELYPWAPTPPRSRTGVEPPAGPTPPNRAGELALLRSALEAIAVGLLRRRTMGAGELLEAFGGIHDDGPSHSRLLRRIAAFEVREAIARDGEETPAVREILAHLSRHLFDPRLWPSSALFWRAMGCEPGDYVRQRRLEVAGRLLCHTHLRIKEIASLLGFRSSDNLTDAFTRWKKIAPSHYRQLHMPARLRGAGWERSLARRLTAPVIRRVERDGAASPVEMRPALERIGEELFEAGLEVNGLAEACQLPASELTVRFHAALGCSPEAYLRQRRLEAAALLLRASDLSVQRIGALVSGRSKSVFYRAFKLWAKLSPSAYRRRQRGARR